MVCSPRPLRRRLRVDGPMAGVRRLRSCCTFTALVGAAFALYVAVLGHSLWTLFNPVCLGLGVRSVCARAPVSVNFLNMG